MIPLPEKLHSFRSFLPWQELGRKSSWRKVKPSWSLMVNPRLVDCIFPWLPSSSLFPFPWTCCGMWSPFSERENAPGTTYRVSRDGNNINSLTVNLQLSISSYIKLWSSVADLVVVCLYPTSCICLSASWIFIGYLTKIVDLISSIFTMMGMVWACIVYFRSITSLFCASAFQHINLLICKPVFLW